MAIEPRVAWVRHVANAAHHNHLENAQHGARNVTSVEIKIILVHLVGPNKRTSWMARDPPVVGAQHDIPKVRTDGPNLDPGVDPPPKVPTA